jgi:predicted nucleic acid-binding protein
VLLVDTGVLLAAADQNDPDHLPCARLVIDEPGPLLTTPMVVAEAGYLIDRQLGGVAEAGFYRSVAAGDLVVEALRAEDWQRIAELVERYADLRLGGTDASLVVLAERHSLRRIATLDRRHFSVVRPLDGLAFELLPS